MSGLQHPLEANGGAGRSAHIRFTPSVVASGGGVGGGGGATGNGTMAGPQPSAVVANVPMAYQPAAATATAAKASTQSTRGSGGHASVCGAEGTACLV